MNALVASLGESVMQERESDLGDVRQLLDSLNRQLHDFITDITKTEFIDNTTSAARLVRAATAVCSSLLRSFKLDCNWAQEILENEQQMNEAELASALQEEADAKREITDLMAKNIRIHKLYPAKVARFQKLRKLQSRLIAGHAPLVRVYLRHKAQRDEQLKQIDNLLDIIHVHYDRQEKAN
jgi:hypothetical protein